MDQLVLNSIFLKIYSDGPWLVATDIDYYSSIATDVDDVIMPVATILLFKCVVPLNPNPGYCHFPTTHPPAPGPPPRPP
jgi:hypothetical protein